MEVYGIGTETTLSLADAETEIRTALAAEGFGVLTEIDVAAVLKEKIGVERSAYKILGACKPQLAHKALSHDEAIGLLLPCNIVLSDTGRGTRVTAVDPEVMLRMAGDTDELRDLAADAKASLSRAVDTLPTAE